MDEREFLPKSHIGEEFGLPERLIRQIGPPDVTRPNPRYRGGAPMRLYRRDRVEQWVRSHPQAIEVLSRRRVAAAQAVQTKREKARRYAAELVRSLRMDAVPGRKRLEREVYSFLSARHGEQFDGTMTERGICSYIRHHYTNYEEILAALEGKVGVGDLYQAVKVILCSEIMRRYHLRLPLAEAVYGRGASDGKTDGDLEAEARAVLRLTGPEGHVCDGVLPAAG